MTCDVLASAHDVEKKSRFFSIRATYPQPLSKTLPSKHIHNPYLSEKFTSKHIHNPSLSKKLTCKHIHNPKPLEMIATTGFGRVEGIQKVFECYFEFIVELLGTHPGCAKATSSLKKRFAARFFSVFLIFPLRGVCFFARLGELHDHEDFNLCASHSKYRQWQLCSASV